MKYFLLFVGIFFLFDSCVTEQESTIIPIPCSTTYYTGTFDWDSVTLSYIDTLIGEATLLSEKLKEAGLKLSSRGKRQIVLALDPDLGWSGAYTLKIKRRRIKITGADPAGVFYGIVSLMQLIDVHGSKINRAVIHDKPRYLWRGFMLDEARHFWGKEKVLQILDWMAYFKLNKFHWHLTDSQGWRIDIEAYPRLGMVGGQGTYSDPNEETAFYYTQDEIREIVDYATARHIEIIPEIDMPGHADASNRAYPQYSGGKESINYPDFTFNPGKEETYRYLTNIMREVSALFPSSYIHIGGDEVSFGMDAWNRDSAV